jgi:phosphinothricin acetyltransferase
MIRPAAAADAPGVAAIWNRVIRETAITFNAEEKTTADVAALIAARQAAGHGFFVAVETRVLGFATYAQFRGGSGYARAMEHTVLLDPAAQSRGLGRALMAKVEDHARAGGAHVLFAGVSSGNPGGRAFHAALGYAEVAVLRQVGWKFGRFHDLHLMEKRL